MGVLKKFSRKLRRSKSGNAAILVALGMPALMGGAGLAVDTAQWYLWQRELQFAADQAALAGAWARGNGDTGTTYVTRADQEFSDNLSIIANNGATHAASLADWGTGTQNSVIVSAEVVADLPFASFVTGRNTTIRVNAQATFERTDEYTACLMALHPTAGSAMWFNGGPTVDAACGVASMSTSGTSIRTNGSGGAQNINTVASAGGIDDGMGAFVNASTIENFDGLNDPYSGLTPPDNPTPQSLSCGSSSVTYSGDESTTVTTSFTYYRGRNANQARNAGTYTYSGAQASTTNTTSSVGNTYTSMPAGGTSTTTSGLYQVDGSGPDKIYEQETAVTTITYSNVVLTSSTSGSMQPGTYTDFEISCDTTLASGIYVIDGGRLKLNGGNQLTGTGVMFVLKGGAQVDINGGADVFLSPMSALELIALGVPADDAARMENMLIFEDPSSPGNTGSKFTGNANFDINGVIYMPNSDLTLAGNIQATANCMMVMSSTVQVSGTADLTTLCPIGETHGVVVGDGGTRVRLVG
uniref:pilus assembly protein TadG-related protein n=1 Tax=uncultured Altererythrobacter sp. TaxID=500840 RepID=UPI002634ADAA|nr:pilus assembly protein TadG-related protein [uncultured Altererythrobacter sp.]